jgi:hypothetical protein
MRPINGDTYTIEEDAEILEPATDGRVRYQWVTGNLDLAGDYLAWFKVVMPPSGAIGILPYDQEDGGQLAAIDIRVEPV